MRVDGKAAFGGIAIGIIKELKKNQNDIPQYCVSDINAEIQRFNLAKGMVNAELENLLKKAEKEAGEEVAAIFEVHQMMLDDDDYCDSIIEKIRSDSINAETAIKFTEQKFAEMFQAMDDAYMRERAADIKDISEQLIRVLTRQGCENIFDEAETIILSDDLAPSETIQLDRSKVLAFVTRMGSTNSHTAILARTMNIPALVCTPVEKNVDGKLAIVDGNTGCIIIDPDEGELQYYQQKKKDEMEKIRLLQDLHGKKTETKSGKTIKLYANIGNETDVENVLQNDAEGIGLFRSEFLYLQSTDYPDEEMQFNVYRHVAEAMHGKQVIVRTLDIGADKKIGYFELPEEDNPALGYRAIRICLDREELFKTQLRALCRASAYGRIAIMLPMISSLWEVRRAKEILGEVQRELQLSDTVIGNIMFGIMIETPAAVMIADELAGEVDFFSIGTNDLTQYTLAIDRQNEKLERYYDAHHPAVLRMIEMVINSAHQAGIWAGICGELGADLSLTEQFIKMGIDELSVAPSMILPIRELIRNIE